MAFITYPLNNIDYTAEDAELFHCTRTSGIWAEDSFPISVTGADSNVTIGTGIAWINNEEFSGKVAALKSAEVLDLGIADSTYPRIDVIAIQFNANNNATDVIVKKGTPASNPVRPAISRTGAIYELYLCSIYRRVGVTSITWDDVTDLRFDSSVCGLMADSVTKVDTDAINNQVKNLIMKLNNEINAVKDNSNFMFITDWTQNGVIPITKGGTNARTSAEARQNINFMGYVPFSETEDDTAENWAALGTGIVMVDLLNSRFDWHCSDGGSFPDQGMILNCVSGERVYQTLFDHQRILTRELGTDNAVDYFWTSFAPHHEIPQDIDQWDDAIKSTNINSGADVLYKFVGNEVRVRVTNCTTTLEMTAPNFSNKKLIAQGLPAPRIRQFGNGLVGNSVAQFYVEPSDDENSGYLRFFGVSERIAAGTKIEAAFSYILDR